MLLGKPIHRTVFKNTDGSLSDVSSKCILHTRNLFGDLYGISALVQVRFATEDLSFKGRDVKKEYINFHSRKGYVIDTGKELREEINRKHITGSNTSASTFESRRALREIQNKVRERYRPSFIVNILFDHFYHLGYYYKTGAKRQVAWDRYEKESREKSKKEYEEGLKNGSR